MKRVSAKREGGNPGQGHTAEQLEVSAAYARSLIEASLDPLVTIAPDGKITDVNEATIKVTGVSRDALIGSDFSNYFTEPDKARAGYRQVFERGFVTDYPLTIRHQDGKLTDVLYNASVYKDVRGNVLGVFAAARDVTESKRVMREFAETKTFLDNILQSSTKYSIIGKDLNHRILSWNEGARRNYGYEAQEIMGRDSSILHTPEDVKSGTVENMLATAYEKGLAEGEFQRVRKDGSRFAASVVVTRRNDTSGRPIGYLLMSTDISDKKQAEEQLRYASQYARSLIEASLDPLVTIAPDGKITDVNEATIKVTGVSRDALIGSDFSNYFTEPDKARAGYRQVFERGFVTDYPLTIRHQDGKLTDVLYNASVYKDARGNVLGVFAAARDVTAQKQASQYARSLIEASLDPLVTISPDGKITDVNEATIKVTGVSRNVLIGSDFSNYFTEPEKARAGYRQVFERGFVTDYPLTIRHVSGKATHVLYNASVYKDTAGKVLGVFAAARDITAQKQAEEELQKAHGELEQRVQQRTAELAKANESLQAEIAERERAEQVIRELSTPVLQVRDGMLILPIIGIIDSQRARQLTEQLLRAIRDSRARVAVVDITGVPAVDSKIANHLLQTSEAARLMGATVVLTGLSPDVAQSLVSIGVDLSRLTTVGDLQGGMQEADRRLGYRVMRTDELPQAQAQGV